MGKRNGKIDFDAIARAVEEDEPVIRYITNEPNEEVHRGMLRSMSDNGRNLENMFDSGELTEESAYELTHP